MGWPWNVLGIERTRDKSAIRRAYAAKLKAMDIDSDIQGYSELRYARDEALREGEYAAEEDQAPVLTDDEGWDEGAESGDLAMDRPGDDRDRPDDPQDDDFAISWDDLQPAGIDTFGYGTGEYVDPNTMVHAGGADGPDRELAELLYPGGQYSEDAFTLKEFDRAQAALDRLLADAKSGDLQQEQAIDNWLAEVLAEGWPRSAPLVEPASAAFDWLAQAGEIGERPALQFLNPRLRGMRFAEKVEQPDHPLNKAWEELKRPGRRSFTDRFKVKREEVQTLLGGIRERYPEVESYLDAERVASWEEAGPEWVSWIVQRLFLLFILVQLLRFCGDIGSETSVPEPPPVAVQEAGIAMPDFVEELFGQDATFGKLAATENELAARVQNLRRLSLAEDDAAAIREGAYFVRFHIHRAVEKASFDDLIAIHDLRRRTAAFVRSNEGDRACAEFLKTARLPDGLELIEEHRAQERRLAWELVGAGLMDPQEDLGGPASAPVPGWFFDAVISKTGATPAQVRDEFAGKQSPRSCAIRLAMLDAMLSRPGDVPPDLLRLR